MNIAGLVLQTKHEYLIPYTYLTTGGGGCGI